MSNIRWRLVMALLSLAATVTLTGPAAASHLHGTTIGEISRNGLVQVADNIWPNPRVIAIIWPNAAPVVNLGADSSGGVEISS